MSGKKNQTINLSGYEAIVDALNTITIEEPEEVKEELLDKDTQEMPKKKQSEYTLPDGEEPKSKRLQLLIKPSTYEALKSITNEKKNLSVNKLINWILEGYINGQL